MTLHPPPLSALRTCPRSKFSFSSSRLLAPPVRRITLGIALGTCCMELFTRSIVVCFFSFLSPTARNTERKQLSADKRGASVESKIRNKSRTNYGGQRSMLCWTRRPVDHLAFLSNTPVNDRSSLSGTRVKRGALRGRQCFRLHLFKIKAPVD